jgi:hypothetical protein
MANLSHSLLWVAILAYLFAMMCYAAEYAFGARGAVARVAERQLVGAGAPVSENPAQDPAQDPVPVPAPDRLASWAGPAGRIAVVLTAFGLFAHLVALVARGVAAHRVPWGNM